MKTLYDLLRPLLFKLDPELAHDLAHKILRRSGGILAGLPLRYEGHDLEVDLFGTRLSNPIGLAAGFDKNARLTGVIGHLGFGFAEIGSITGRPSIGNPRPRLFRLPQDHALINRLGLNGEGAESVALRLKTAPRSVPIAINIAKTNDPAIQGDAAVEDVLHSFKQIRDLSPLYVAINASCPNTHEGCVKETAELATTFEELQKLNTHQIPLLVKLSPDSTDELLDKIVELSIAHKLNGYVCGNTTVTRNGLSTSKDLLTNIGAGGLSGPPLKPLAVELCRRVYVRKSADQKIIGVGGISNGRGVLDFVKAGATTVELYTALIYRGPGLISSICRELSSLLQAESLTLEAAVGAGVSPASPISHKM